LIFLKWFLTNFQVSVIFVVAWEVAKIDLSLKSDTNTNTKFNQLRFCKSLTYSVHQWSNQIKTLLLLYFWKDSSGVSSWLRPELNWRVGDTWPSASPSSSSSDRSDHSSPHTSTGRSSPCSSTSSTPWRSWVTFLS